MNSRKLYNEAFAYSAGSKALTRLKVIYKNAHNRMTCEWSRPCRTKAEW